MKAMIIYDTGDGIIIYEAVLTGDEALRMESLQGRCGGTVGMSVEDDEFLANIDSVIGDIKKVFDGTGSDLTLMAPITLFDETRVFVTGFAL